MHGMSDHGGICTAYHSLGTSGRPAFLGTLRRGPNKWARSAQNLVGIGMRELGVERKSTPFWSKSEPCHAPPEFWATVSSTPLGSHGARVSRRTNAYRQGLKVRRRGCLRVAASEAESHLDAGVWTTPSTTCRVELHKLCTPNKHDSSKRLISNQLQGCTLAGLPACTPIA